METTEGTAPAPAPEATPAPAAPASEAPVGTLTSEGVTAAQQMQDSDQEATRESVSDLERFLFADPFTETPLPQKPAKAAEPVAPTAPAAPSGQAPATPSPAAPPKVEAPPPSAAPDPRDQAVANLTTQLNILKAQLQGFQQMQQQPQPQAQPQAQPGQEQPFYSRLTVPDELMDAISSEDAAVRKHGMTALIQGIARVISEQTQQAIMQGVPQVVSEHVEATTRAANERKNVSDDYYGKYSNHKMIPEVVGMITRQAFQELGVTRWSPEIRDIIGSRVNAYLQAAGAQTAGSIPAPGLPAAAPAVPAPMAPPVQQARPPHVFGGVSSPAVGAPGDPNAPDGIFKTLFG